MKLKNVCTPFCEKKIVMYDHDGNITVEHIPIQQISGNIYKSENFAFQIGFYNCILYAYYDEYQIGMYLYTVDAETLIDVALSWVNDDLGYKTPDSFIEMVQRKIHNSEYVRNIDIGVLNYLKPDLVDKAKESSARFWKNLELIQQEEYSSNLQQNSVTNHKLDFYGWSDNMTSRQFGKVCVSLDKIVQYNGKQMYKYEYIAELLREGHKPFKIESKDRNYMGRDTDSKTIYGLKKPDELWYHELDKIAYEYAQYLYENNVLVEN